jgi:hypothetical protein
MHNFNRLVNIKVRNHLQISTINQIDRRLNDYLWDNIIDPLNEHLRWSVAFRISDQLREDYNIEE